MLEIKLTDEEWELRRSYQRKQRAKQLHLATPEERVAIFKYRTYIAKLNPITTCIVAWKAGAKKRGKQWDLSVEYLTALCINTTVCPYLKLPLVYDCFNGTGKHNPCKASLDRIDSTKGYVEGNVQIVSWALNQIKSNFTDEQLMLYCKNIVNYLENKDDGIFG